jgi:serine/threonine protein phosphatase PrpC
MVGASRRGRLHEHEGTFREDAFAIEAAAGWWLVAVADGAGSHHLSRVGSKVAVKTAVQAMVNRVKKTPPLDVTARVALQEALKCAWKALYDEAQKREVNFKDLSTTLLLLAYHPGNNLVGVAQIGDGLLAAQLEDSNIALLGQPESGEYSGETVFLTNHKFAELESKVETPEPPGPLKLLFVMTDGVADDLYPPQDRLPVLIEPMPEVLAADDPKQALLELINYPRTGSFDDRTLVVLCQPEKLLKAAGATAVVTQPEESAPSEPKSETEQQASEQPIGEEMATAAETSVQGAEREAD